MVRDTDRWRADGADATAGRAARPAPSVTAEAGEGSSGSTTSPASLASVSPVRPGSSPKPMFKYQDTVVGWASLEGGGAAAPLPQFPGAAAGMAIPFAPTSAAPKAMRSQALRPSTEGPAKSSVATEPPAPHADATLALETALFQECVDAARGKRQRESRPSSCPHGRQRYYCKDCGGAGICPHNRRKKACKACGGSQICEHNRRKSTCKECKGSCLCIHNRIKGQCKECGGSQICEHQRERSHCKECGGSGICVHQRRKSRCRECKLARAQQATLGAQDIEAALLLTGGVSCVPPPPPFAHAHSLSFPVLSPQWSVDMAAKLSNAGASASQSKPPGPARTIKDMEALLGNSGVSSWGRGADEHSGHNGRDGIPGGLK